MKPSLRYLVALVTVILVGTAWSVSSYLSTLEPLGQVLTRDAASRAPADHAGRPTCPNCADAGEPSALPAANRSI